MEEEIKDAKVGGLRAVEINYRGIREFASGDISFLQSKTRLNTPDYGTLMPETFRKVSELSNQCISLCDLEFRQVMEAIKNLQNRDFYFRWCSVYMPLRQLTEKGMHQKMMSKMDEFEVDTNRVCFELSPSVLVEGTKSHSAAIENLRNRGFHFMITEFGGMSSPLMRLAFFPVDYVMLSSEMIGYLRDDDRSLSAIGSIVEFAEGMGATTIADGVAKSEHAEMLYRAQCNFGAGPLAGNYVGERYLRKKKSADD